MFVSIVRACSMAALLASCSGGAGDEEAMRAEAQVLSQAQGEAAPASAERIARFGRRAIPSIEAALHTAEPSGRKNLILGLRRIGDAEAVPLLGHLAAWDAAPDVRREAEWTLKSWASGKDARATRAAAALRALDELREREGSG
jgi:hypothetical protein